MKKDIFMFNVGSCLDAASRFAFWGGTAALNVTTLPVTCFTILGYANKLTAYVIERMSTSEDKAKDYRNDGYSYLQLARSYIPVDARIELAWASVAFGCLSRAIKGEVLPNADTLVFGISLLQTLSSFVVPYQHVYERSRSTCFPGEPTAPKKGHGVVPEYMLTDL